MLITEEYRKEQERLHENPNYGVASVEFAPLVAQIINKFGVNEVLDYGAGKCRLAQTLGSDHLLQRAVTMYGYDPGRPELSETPDPCEMVTCIDVLEHIEPELLDNVLDDLQRVTKSIGFFTIHTGPAVKTLSDGRNAHLIQEPMIWWLTKLDKRFDVQCMQKTRGGFYVVVKRAFEQLRQSEIGDSNVVKA
jgi:hypothetical protein